MSLSPDMPDDPLDLLLRQAMTARPEERAGIDLAAAALSRARRREVQAASLARLGRWIGASVVAAGILVAISLAYVMRSVPTRDDGTSVQLTTITATSTDSSGSETATYTLAGIAAVGIALAGVMGSDRRAPRLVPV